MPPNRQSLQQITKDAWNRWLPTLIGLIGLVSALLAQAVSYGEFKQELANTKAALSEERLERRELGVKIDQLIMTINSRPNRGD